jgi:hypothetical protein
VGPPSEPGTTGEAIADAIASGDTRPLRDRYAPGATLETHLPGRSVSVRGRASVLEGIAVEAPARVRILARRPSRFGVVMRLESTGAEGTSVRRSRHLVHLERGLVSRHIVYPERTPAARPSALPETSDTVAARVIRDIRERTSLEPGISGCLVERWRLADGRTLFAKHLRPEDSWLMRASDDHGREAELFRSGVLGEIEPLADHAVMAAVAEDGGWLLLSDDRSVALAHPPRSPSGRARLLGRTIAIGERFLGRDVPGACPIEVRLRVFSPDTALRERAGTDLAPKVIGRGWELFAEMARPTVASAVRTLAEDPAPLARALAELPATLVHGDLRAGNVGWSAGRAVLVDWGLAMVAPTVFDLTWWLFNAGWRSATGLDRMLEEVRALLPGVADRAVGLGLLATLVQAASYFGFEAAQNPDPSARRRAREGLAWWSERALDGLGSL